MNRKVLLAIIVVLALVLIVGIVFIVAMSKPVDAPTQSVTQSTTGDVANQPTDSAGEAVAAPGQTGATAVGGGGTEQGNGNTGATENTSAAQPEEEKPTEEAKEETTPLLIPNAPEVSVPSEDKVTYLEYHAMSGDEQAAFINTFGSYEAFFAWYNAAEKEYNDSRIPIEEDGKIDLGGN